MASSVAALAKPLTEEIHFQKGDVALCLLVNRRTRTLRVIDFRSGPSLLKREIVRRVAAEEGLERAFTVVEREEAALWVRFGFRKEGNLPGFYKRTDAHLLGMAISQGAEPARAKRLTLPRLAEGTIADEPERAYQAGRRLVRSWSGAASAEVKVHRARDSEVTLALSAAARAGRALTELEPFGRGGQRNNYLATGRGGFSWLVSVERQPCFDNALVEVLTAPRSHREAWLATAALRQVTALLDEEHINATFAMSLADSAEMTAVLVGAGFRRTGRLPGHLMIHGARRDAFLWSRRIADGVSCREATREMQQRRGPLLT